MGNTTSQSSTIPLSKRFRSFLLLLKEKNTTKDDIQRKNLLFVEQNILNAISQRLNDINSVNVSDFDKLTKLIIFNLHHDLINISTLNALDNFDSPSSQIITNYIDIIFDKTILYDINNMNISWLNCYYQWLYVSKHHADTSFIINVSKLDNSLLIDLINNLR